jgi:hypothetical protein
MKTRTATIDKNMDKYSFDEDGSVYEYDEDLNFYIFIGELNDKSQQEFITDYKNNA